jgi:tetratricopeptide (TPR) repeat protein
VHMERAVALAPTDETLQLALVSLLHLTRDHAALERAVARGLKACPGNAGLHFEAGMLAVDAGRLDEAVPYLEFAAKNRPDQPAAALELAKVHFRAGRAAVGVEILERLLRANPALVEASANLVRHGIEARDARTKIWLQQAQNGGVPPELLAELRRNYERRFGEAP